VGGVISWHSCIEWFSRAISSHAYHWLVPCRQSCRSAGAPTTTRYKYCSTRSSVLDLSRRGVY
jgi:hypothetical protein